MKLCVDAGHGFQNVGKGYDPGAQALGYSEAATVLAYAQSIQFIFKQAGIEVFLTRDEVDDPCPVGTRAKKAKAAGCSHFISLHLNTANGKASGTETYYRSSSGWAGQVQGVALKAFGLKNRGLKTEAESQHSKLAVLDFKGQACLLELGFIDSAKDMKVIAARGARVALAQGLLSLWKQIAQPSTR